MRIVFLADGIPPHHQGGGGKIPWRLAKGFHTAGHTLSIITATPEKSYREIRESIPVYYVHSHYPLRWRAWLSLYNPQTVSPVRRLLAELQPEVVNAHNIHTDLSYASIAVAGRMGFPVVFSAHDAMTFAYTKLNHFIDPTRCGVQSSEQYRLPMFYNLRQNRLRYNPLRNVVIRQILRRYTQVRIAISQAHRDALEANHLPPFEVIYHGFDAAEYQLSDLAHLEALRNRLGLAGKRVILFGGRLTTLKGSRQLLEAFNQAVIQIPDARLLVLSSAPLDHEWLAGLENIRAEHICEAGWLSEQELIAAYHLADVVAVPSICLDTLPTTLFEAMAAGKPTLATCYGGSPELVVDGVTGFVINPFDTATFTDRIIRLLSDDALCLRMGAAGLERVSRQFTFQQQLDRMLAAYERAIEMVSL
jgi:glycosyltransferase involved in cell wall biosynthesis